MKSFVVNILIFLCLIACSQDEDPAPRQKPIIEAPKATNVVIRDLADDGNPSDYNLSFNRAFEEEKILEYRAFLLPDGREISVEEANDLEESQFLRLRKGVFRYDTTFRPGMIDGLGQPVEIGKPYRAWVLNVADGDKANTNTFSSPSAPEELKIRNILVTYIGNAGVMVEGFGKKILIDALPGGLSGWRNISPNFRNKLKNAADPFDDVDLLCITHNHGDHFNPSDVSEFALASPSTRIIAPLDVLNGTVLPGEVFIPLGQLEYVDTIIAGIQLSVFHFKHFDMFGNDFSTVNNYGFMIDIGDFRFLHVGDFEFSSSNLDIIDFKSKGIDLFFMPAFNTLISQDNKNIIDQKIAPGQIAALHLQNTTTTSSITNIFGDIVVFTDSEQHISF